MELVVENICAVEKAEIELENITVIAGDNGTGKSTVSKAFYAVGNAISNLDEKVNEEKVDMFKYNFANCLQAVFEDDTAAEYCYDPLGLFSTDSNAGITKVTEYLTNTLKTNPTFWDNKESLVKLLDRLPDDRFDSLDKRDILDAVNVSFDEVIERPDVEYATFILVKAVNDVFAEQANNLYNKTFGKICLRKKQMTKGIEVCVLEDMESRLGGKPFTYTGNVIYMETKHLLDEYIDSFVSSPESEKIRVALKESAKDKAKLTIAQYEELKKAAKVVDSVLEQTVKGKLVYQGWTFYYQENGKEELINIKNVASGLKNLLVVAKLVKNGSLKSGDILIIDEPETNQHPKWQVAFAELLVLLNKELNIKILINSHSPYFIRAIECKMAKYETLDKAKFYLMEHGEDNGYVAKDVTSSTENIYKELYQPLEEL